jgi:uncharacterized membrane protein
MNENIVAVVFNSHTQAEEAAAELRQAGVSDSAISVIAQQQGHTTSTDGAGEAVAEKAGDAAKGAVGGAVLGTLLGVAALAIPGVGPLVGAGAIAASAVPGAAATGAALGAAGGGLLGLLTGHGVDERDAKYFETHIRNGAVFVSVDTSQAGASPQAVRDILERNGGHRSEAAQGDGAGLSLSSSM